MRGSDERTGSLFSYVNLVAPPTLLALADEVIE
jgi:hypothetical protein